MIQVTRFIQQNQLRPRKTPNRMERQNLTRTRPHHKRHSAIKPIKYRV